MNVIFCVRGLNQFEGGPTYSVPALAKAIALRGHNVSVLVDNYDISLGPLLKIVRRCELAQPLREYFKSFDIIHDNGVWLPFNHAIAKAARDAGVPRVISPRGGLQPWVRAQRRWKKWLGWQLFQRRDLLNASAVFGTAEIETNEVRALGFRGHTWVIPNGIDVPGPVLSAAKGATRRALFLSRLHPKKGVDDLIACWIRIAPKDWVLDLVGPDEANMVERNLEHIRKAGMEDRILFHGPKYGEDKLKLFQSASLFLLPTYSENFGNSVVEAMLMELPVLTTTETPWANLERDEIGWVVQPGEEKLLPVLTSALACDPDKLGRMGVAAREWAQGRFTWDVVGEQVEQAYERILRK